MFWWILEWLFYLGYFKRNRRVLIKFEENEERDEECSFIMDIFYIVFIVSEIFLNITKNFINDGE